LRNDGWLTFGWLVDDRSHFLSYVDVIIEEERNADPPPPPPPGLNDEMFDCEMIV